MMESTTSAAFATACGLFPQAALCLCLAGLGVAVPGHYFAAALVEPLRDRGAHPPETDQTDFHLKHPPGPLPQRLSL
jgi:hypothetical protein